MEKLKEIAEWFGNWDITLFYVGGCVRDEIMGNPVEDIDICVVGGKTAADVQVRLASLVFFNHITHVTPVHGSFPIWIVEIDGEKYEFAMARKERKTGQTRQEFECEVNDVTIEEDLMRRDLTINAIAKNVATGEIVDPYGGIYDIQHRIAHPVSKAFKEDPIRPYRAARFIAKFNLAASIKLQGYCIDLKPDGLSNERVGMELMKMLKTAKKPSLFFNFLREVGWLKYHFPELHALIGVPQSPTHHPEGDAYTHTMHCIDAAQGWFYRAIMLCHDLGKALTTEISYIPFDGIPLKDEDFVPRMKITAHGHEEAGVQLTKNMLKRIFFADHKTIDQIACLVELHMIRIIITKDNYDKIVRRTARKLHNQKLGYNDLIIIIHYDLSGRPPKPTPKAGDVATELYYEHYWFLQQTDAFTPIVTGERLIARGMLPGPEMGKIISHALELQDRGTLKANNWQKVLKGCGYKFFQTPKTTDNGMESR